MSEFVEPHSCIHDVASGSEVPKVGMDFENDKEAYEFYNKYAGEIGFTVRELFLDLSSEGIITSRRFVCCNEGGCGNSKEEYQMKNPQSNERTGCLACMTIKTTNTGKYRVIEFQPSHNHELVTSRKAPILKPQRITEVDVAVVDLEDDSRASLKTTNELLKPGEKISESVEPHPPIKDVGNGNGVPKVDMEFENDEKAYHFYSKYAGEIGFNIRRHWLARSPKGIIKSRTFVCCKEGYQGNTKEPHLVKKPRLDGRTGFSYSARARMTINERTGCSARMTIKIMKNGKYRVSEFQPDHNHDLVTLTEGTSSVRDLNDSSTVLKATRKVMSREAGGSKCLKSKKLGDAGAMRIALPLFRESDEKMMVLTKERDLLLEQRDSAIHEALQWRSELAVARDRVVKLETAVIGAEKRARALEVDAKAKEEEMNAAKDKRWQQQQLRQRRLQQRRQQLQRQRGSQNNAKKAVDEKSELCSGADNMIDNVDKAGLSNSRLVPASGETSVQMAVDILVNIGNPSCSELQSEDARRASCENSPAAEASSSGVAVEQLTKPVDLLEDNTEKACLSDFRLDPVSVDSSVQISIGPEGRPTSEGECGNFHSKEGRIADGNGTSLEAKESSLDVPGASPPVVEHQDEGNSAQP